MANNTSSPNKKRFISEGGHESPHKYKLREVSKPPTRYKDYFDSSFDQIESGEKIRKRHKSFNGKVEEIEGNDLSPVNVNNEISCGRQGRKMLKPSKIDVGELKRKSSRCSIFCTKLKRTRQWMQYEFFYSALDHQLFLGENDFAACLRTDFPNLKTRMLTLPEWRTVKRLIGKPRRFSQNYLVEEMQSIEMKRNKLRMIYNGNINILQPDWASDLPLKIPRPLAVGMNVFVRLTKPIIGVYYGRIDAVHENSFRIIFENDKNLSPMMVDDINVMPEVLPELVSVQSFIDQYRNNSHKSILGRDVFIQEKDKKIFDLKEEFDDSGTVKHPPPRNLANITTSTVKDDKVGNFPVRMLVLLVKLHKLVDMKKELVSHLDLLNGEAEKCHLVSGEYPFELQQTYAKLIIQLENINETTQNYIKIVNEYLHTLQPANHTKVEKIIKVSDIHAKMITKNFNNQIEITCDKTKLLIKNLTKLLLMFRTFGYDKKEVNLYNFYATVSDNISGMKEVMYKDNKRVFEEEVEVNFKEFIKLFEEHGRGE
uniref:DIRP domain-containing protein n=1 Tax=Parastrongyloides trichosuri TaxID=131310 RepID=A0A0N4Z2D7_PARTI